MQFSFSEEQRTFQTSMRTFLEHECTPHHVRALWDTDTGRSPERWTRLAELGLLGVLVPLLAGLEGSALAGAWLRRVAEGTATLAVGHEANEFVADAHVADLLLMQHRDELHAVPRAHADLEHQPCNDPSRRLFRVSWSPTSETRVARGREAAQLLAAALDRGALAAAAQLIGVGQQLVDLAVRYATQREQFGRPIGSFQAVKHMLANVAVRLEFARPVVYRAAFSVARDVATRTVDVSHAKVAAAEAAAQAARVALQVHGAMGYTWEVDLHIWMKRAWALALAWGSTAWHRERVARVVLDGASDD